MDCAWFSDPEPPDFAVDLDVKADRDENYLVSVSFGSEPRVSTGYDVSRETLFVFIGMALERDCFFHVENFALDLIMRVRVVRRSVFVRLHFSER